MEINGTWIEDEFAEAFSMKFSRFLVTAYDQYWLDHALAKLTGYGCSAIGCDAEIDVETQIPSERSPDGRVGASVLAFSFTTDTLGTAILNRIGQTILTCPTTAVFDGLPDSETRIPIGKSLRYFGDGFQKSKMVGDIRYWRIPVMDGEFVVEESFGVEKGVAGGNFLIQTRDQLTGLQAAQSAVEAIKLLPDVVTPFPGGVVRSGSKVGSRYPGLVASTYDAFCPTLVGRTTSKIAERANCVYEIVLDGTSFDSVANALKLAINAACEHDVIAISAGNYGGKLGKHHFKLHEILTTHST